MATPFLGQILITAFNFAPTGFALCNGQALSIQQNQALFALLGTMYGGDGIQTFALPNLQGRVPIHSGGDFVPGASGGEVSHTLITAEIPSHTHPVTASSADPNSATGANGLWARNNASPYAPSANAVMNAASVSGGGGNQPHNNMPPYLTISFCIAMLGIFPSRS